MGGDGGYYRRSKASRPYWRAAFWANAFSMLCLFVPLFWGAIEAVRWLRHGHWMGPAIFEAMGKPTPETALYIRGWEGANILLAWVARQDLYTIVAICGFVMFVSLRRESDQHVLTAVMIESDEARERRRIEDESRG